MQQTLNIASQLDEKGLVVLDAYFSNELINQSLVEVRTAFNLLNDVKQVNGDNIIIKTINGEKLIASCPTVKILYDEVFQFLQKEFEKVVELEDNEIGISSNFLNGKLDKFRLHFDRNQLTVVIYLNDNLFFPLMVYPNIRRDPMTTGIKDKFELESATSIKVYPKTNLAIIFYGRRTFHGVLNELTSTKIAEDRFSLQFAFDFEKMSYQGQEYYGKQSNISIGP